MGESVVRLVLGGEGNPESITDVMCNGSSTAAFCLQRICAYEAIVALSKQYIMSEDLVKKSVDPNHLFPLSMPNIETKRDRVSNWMFSNESGINVHN